MDRTARLWDVATGRQVALLQHDTSVVLGRFSPDGRRVLTIASRNYSPDRRLFITGGLAAETAARTWDAATGKLLATWKDPGNEDQMWTRRHRDVSYAASFSPDGRRVVTTFGVYPDCPPRLHETDTGKELALLTGHQGPVVDVAFHPDGRHIVTASLDGTVRVWQADSGKHVRTWTSPDGGVVAVVLSPDGTRLLTAGDGQKCSFVVQPDRVACVFAPNDGTRPAVAARIQDFRSGKEMAVLRWPGNVFREGRRPAFSADGTLVLLGACVWEAATGKVRATLDGHTRPQAIHCGAFSPDGCWALTAGDDRTARFWDARTGKPATVLRGHEGPIYAAAFSPDGQLVLTASADHTARLWDSALADEYTPLRGRWPALRCVALSPDGRRLAGNLEADHTRGRFLTRVWDTDTGQELAVLRGHQGTVGVVAFSPDGRKVATGSDDHTARVWEADTGKPLALLRGHSGGITSIAFSPDGERVLTASTDQGGRIWNAATGAEMVRLEGSKVRALDLLKKGGDLSQMAEAVVIYRAWFSPDGRRVLSTSAGKQLSLTNNVAARVWDAATGKELGVLKASPQVGNGQCVVFGPDSRRVLVAGGSDACIWDSRTGKLQTLKGDGASVEWAAFSPDGRRVVTAPRDKTARVWDVQAGREIAVLKGHEEAITFACWSPDGERLVTLGRDGTARLWNAESYKETATLRWRDVEWRWAAFSSDGRHVLTESWNGARLWPIDLLQAARQRRPRPLTDRERERFEIGAAWLPGAAARGRIEKERSFVSAGRHRPRSR